MSWVTCTTYFTNCLSTCYTICKIKTLTCLCVCVCVCVCARARVRAWYQISSSISSLPRIRDSVSHWARSNPPVSTSPELGLQVCITTLAPYVVLGPHASGTKHFTLANCTSNAAPLAKSLWVEITKTTVLVHKNHMGKRKNKMSISWQFMKFLSYNGTDQTGRKYLKN